MATDASGREIEDSKATKKKQIQGSFFMHLMYKRLVLTGLWSVVLTLMFTC